MISPPQIIYVLLLSSATLCSWPPKEKRLITLFGTGRKDLTGTWMTPKEIFKLVRARKGFMDITNVPNSTIEQLALSGRAEKIYPIPTEIRFEHIVTEKFRNIRINRARQYVQTLSRYKTRASNSKQGVDAATWLKYEIDSFIKIYNLRAPASVRLGPGDMNVSTIIVQLEGQAEDPKMKKQVIVLSAHMDSINERCYDYLDYDNGIETESYKDCESRQEAPGADDNGSGVSVLLETLVILANSDIIPKRTIEFHFYAGEEYYIRGAEFVGKEYWDNYTQMIGLLNVDCAGWRAEGSPKQVGIHDVEETNSQLTEFVYKLGKKYLKYEAVKGNFLHDGSTSDYEAWYWFSYPSAHMQEIKLTPFIHTWKDEYDTVDFEQVVEFIKLSIAYLIEYAEPMKNFSDSSEGRDPLAGRADNIRPGLTPVKKTWAVYAKK